jgi:ankyrin repeat protein
MHLFASDLSAKPSMAAEHKRAGVLFKAAQKGDTTAIARVRYSHPVFAGLPDAIVAEDVRLKDARFVVAREYGFSDWAGLRVFIEALGGKKELRRPFETEAQYYRDRAGGMLSVFATAERNAIRLVRLFHPDYAKASDADARAAKLTQADAELIVAREHGFETWDAFANYIELLREKRVSEPFRLAFEAIKDNNRPRLGELLRQHRKLVNAAGTNGNRLIMLAMSCGRAAMVDDLLIAGADPALANNKGWTALHQAAYADPTRNGAAAIVMLELLLKAGASPYAEAYGDGGTPLAISLFWGHVEIAERLAQTAIAPLNLRVAAGLGRVDLIQSLFKGKTLRPEAGWHRDFHRPHSGFPAWMPRNDRKEILAEALTYAARSGRIDAMAFLLEQGADVNAEPCNGTALHWAIARRKTQAAAWLLDHGADINRRSGFGGTKGVTPLHVAAAWEGNPDGARLLLDRGADRSIKDAEHDSTPAGWAGFFKNDAIKLMIDSHG